MSSFPLSYVALDALFRTLPAVDTTSNCLKGQIAQVLGDPNDPKQLPHIMRNLLLSWAGGAVIVPNWDGVELDRTVDIISFPYLNDKAFRAGTCIIEVPVDQAEHPSSVESVARKHGNGARRAKKGGPVLCTSEQLERANTKGHLPREAVIKWISVPAEKSGGAETGGKSSKIPPVGLKRPRVQQGERDASEDLEGDEGSGIEKRPMNMRKPPTLSVQAPRDISAGHMFETGPQTPFSAKPPPTTLPPKTPVTPTASSSWAMKAPGIVTSGSSTSGLVKSGPVPQIPSLLQRTLARVNAEKDGLNAPPPPPQPPKPAAPRSKIPPPQRRDPWADIYSPDTSPSPEPAPRSPARSRQGTPPAARQAAQDWRDASEGFARTLGDLGSWRSFWEVPGGIRHLRKAQGALLTGENGKITVYLGKYVTRQKAEELRALHTDVTALPWEADVLVVDEERSLSGHLAGEAGDMKQRRRYGTIETYDEERAIFGDVVGLGWLDESIRRRELVSPSKYGFRA